MRILFVLENYIPHIGGVEIVFKNLCEGLAKRGHDVSIVTHRMKKTLKFEVINGVKVHRVNCFHSRYWFTFLSLKNVLKLGRNADIIHTTTFNAAFPSWFAAKLLRKKCIITVHEAWVGKWRELTEMGWFSTVLHDMLERLIYLLNFDVYACVSKSTENQVHSIKKGRIITKVIYNGVDYDHWNPEKYDGKKIRETLGLSKSFVYLFTGRPGVSKGIEYLLKAVPLISSKISNAKLLAIVSKDKAYEKRYAFVSGLIKQLGVTDKVILHDPVSYKELPNYVKAADCVVVPSLSEGFGFTAAEACAMGIPVVASDTTSLPEVVSGKFVFVKPGDERSISEAVVKVHDKDYSISKLKKFENESFLNRYLELYNFLLA